MNQIALFILLGMAAGTLYAGLGVAVVLQYRGSSTIDFSLGAVAMTIAYVFYGLKTNGTLFVPIPFVPLISVGNAWSIGPALAVSLLIAAGLGCLFSLALRQLRNSSAIARLIASLGMLLGLQAMVILRYGVDGYGAPAVLPSTRVAVFNGTLTIDRFILMGLVVGGVVFLMILYRRSRYGLATRAVTENERGAVLAGLSPNRIGMINTTSAYVVAGLIGVLVAPASVLDPQVLTLAILPALAAALLGQFTSFGITAAAGLALGAIESLITLASAQSWFPRSGGVPWPGFFQVAVFLIVVAALLWRGKGIPERGGVTPRSLPPAPRPKRIVRPTLALSILGVAGLLVLPYDFRQAEVNTLVAIALMLSFVVITGFVGQISIMQLATAGAAAFLLYVFTVRLHIGFPWAALLAVPIGTLAGVAVGIPALRIRGVHLAIITLAAAVAVENFWFRNPSWGDNGLHNTLPSPQIGPVNLGASASFPGWDGKVPSPVLGLFILLGVVALAVFVSSLRRSTLGQQMLAVRSSERASAAAGINVRNVKLTASAISSLIAAIAGVLFAYDYGSVSGGTFAVVVGLSALAAAYIGGVTTVAGAVFAGLAIQQALFDHAIHKWTGLSSNYYQLIGALGLMFTLLVMPDGIALAHSQGRAPHSYVFKAVVWPVRKLSRGHARNAEGPAS